MNPHPNLDNNSQSPQTYPILDPVKHINPNCQTGGYPHLPPHNPQQPQQYHQQYQQPYPKPNPNQQNYLPPNQYANHAINQHYFDQRTQQVKAVEDQLESGSIVAFKIWMWLLSISCALALGYAIFIFFVFGVFYRFEWAVMAWFSLASSIMIWLGYFCFQQLRALHNKDFKAATKALASIKSFAVFMLLIFAAFGVFYFYGGSFFPETLLNAFLSFVFFYLIPILINFKGSKKVHKILEEKEALLFNVSTGCNT